MADEAPRYPCGTIAEMAAIPLEARERFIAEFPQLLKSIDSLEAINAVTRSLGFEVVLQTPIWVDDDKDTTTINLTLPQ